MALLISISCFTVLVLATLLFQMLRHNRERAHLRSKINSLVLDIDKERGNQKDIIFRNMHDHVNPMLRFVMRNMEMHRHNLLNKKLAPEAFEQDIDILITALNDIRSCTHGEAPEMLASNGYLSTLEKMTHRGSSLGMQIEFENNTSFDKDIPFDNLRELDLFRISSELLENVFKHSHGKKLKVSVSEAGESLCLQVVHDGRGITNEMAQSYIQMNKGTGLQSCKARARLLNAELDYSTSNNSNTITLTIPFQWKTQLG